MRRRALTALVLAAVVAATVAVGSSRSGPGPPVTGLPAAGPPFPQLLGMVPEGRQQQLVRLDPDTLRPVGGRRVGVGSEGCAPRSGGQACWRIPAWSFSPDRSLLGVARHHAGVARALRLVDIARMRVAAEVPLGGGGAVGLVAWPARGRMLAIQEICCEGRQQLLVVDVARRRVAARQALGGSVLRVGRTPRELVLLIASPEEIGPARLVVADGRGAVRSLRLGRMLAGERLLDRTSLRLQRRLPGLAVDPEARRVFAVDRGRVADVDLVSLAVSYHELAGSTSLLARLRDWLDPAAYAKGVSGPSRSAHWLGGGLLAVTGVDEEASTDARGEDQTRVRPAGLSLVDTRSWSVRTIDRGATDVRVARDLLLATGSSSGPATGQEESIGLTAYDLDGGRRFELFDGREAWVEQVYDGRAYVSVSRPDGRQARRVVDLRTGRVAGGRAGRLPWLLLDAASSWWED